MLGLLQITSGYAGILYFEQVYTRDQATHAVSTFVKSHVMLA
jgi:multisubunit Na+/H+ antiporter MnhG subunit